MKHRCPRCRAIDYLPGPDLLARCRCGQVYRRAYDGPPRPELAPTTYDAWPDSRLVTEAPPDPAGRCTHGSFVFTAEGWRRCLDCGRVHDRPQHVAVRRDRPTAPAPRPRRGCPHCGNLAWFDLGDGRRRCEGPGACHEVYSEVRPDPERIDRDDAERIDAIDRQLIAAHTGDDPDEDPGWGDAV